jgi:hypothetical protein
MEVITFNDDQQLLEEYVDFGYQLYSGDNHFIPPRRGDLESSLSAHSCTFRKPGNEVLHFLARDRGKVIGRISAFVNRDLHDRDGTPVGTLGHFECVDDYHTARALLDSAIRWLVDHHGLRRIWGPMNSDIWHGYRFKTNGFQETPFVGEPYNKPYYPEHFVRYGFSTKAEWDSLEVSGRGTISNMISRGESRYRLLRGRGYRFEHMHPSRQADDLPKLHQVLCSSFAGFLGYTEIPLAEFASLFERSSAAFDSDLAVIVYNEQNKLAGFAIACIELSEAVLAMGGKTHAWSRLKFAYYRNRARTVIQQALDKGLDTILLTLRLKGNLAHGLAARSGCVPQREYALYEWNHE